MTVNQCLLFIQFLARKNQTGNITPTEFGTAYNSAQRSTFDHLLGRITLAPHVALGQNGRISERLKPFKVTEATVAVTSQIALYPPKFIAVTSIKDATTSKDIQFMDDAKLSKRLSSSLDPIAEANPPVFTNTATGWKIWPATITSIKVSYYTIPTDVLWDYIPDADGRPVYDETNSENPLWDDLTNEDILAKTCMLLGFSFEKQSLVQYGATKTAEV